MSNENWNQDLHDNQWNTDMTEAKPNIIHNVNLAIDSSSLQTLNNFFFLQSYAYFLISFHLLFYFCITHKHFSQKILNKICS